MTGLAWPDHLRLQVFSTSWRLFPPRACWPYFVPDPLLGFALQSFSPPTQPCAVSDAVTLMMLEVSKTVPRSSFPSRIPKQRARSTRSHMGKPPGAPHLQGISPRESPPHRTDGLGRSGHVALLGFIPSRVLSLSGTAAAFTTASPHEVTRSGAEATDRALYRVSVPLRLAHLSRGCRPSWGFSPCDPPWRFGLTAARELPPQVPGYVTAPSSDRLRTVSPTLPEPSRACLSATSRCDLRDRKSTRLNSSHRT